MIWSLDVVSREPFGQKIAITNLTYMRLEVE
jgi:hypothetical protein